MTFCKENKVVKNNFKTTKLIRLLNLIGIVLWGLSVAFDNDSVGFLGALFFVYCYFWLYILFIILEWVYYFD